MQNTAFICDRCEINVAEIPKHPIAIVRCIDMFKNGIDFAHKLCGPCDDNIPNKNKRGCYCCRDSIERAGMTYRPPR